MSSVAVRRLFVPEVVQTSAMDCGPASLKALLEGFGVSVSYGRLREACQTDVDGTSIDTLEEVARQLGLAAEQVMLPLDHVLLDEVGALPAIVVVLLPGGATHFVVVWRRHGGWLQVMDPGTGRRWVRASSLLRDLYVHSQAIPAAAWREWASDVEFRGATLRRLRELGVSPGDAAALLREANDDPGWGSLGRLDAAIRLVSALARASALRRGREASRALAAVLARATQDPSTIPSRYYSVLPTKPEGVSEEEHVLLVGAVLVRVGGLRDRVPAGATDGEPEAAALSPELVAALSEAPENPARELWAMLRTDGLASPVALTFALGLAATAALVEVLLFRGMFHVGARIAPGLPRAFALAALLAFIAAMVALEYPMGTSLLRLGRHLEARLRVAYLAKLPRLGDRYFHSRLASDMAERGHMLQIVRRVPELGSRLVRSIFALGLTVSGIAWLDRASAPLAVLIASLSIALPLVFQPLLKERDLRMRTHEGALTRFYLDALLGLVPVRAHGAERSVRREHEGLLVDWLRAGLRLQRAVVSVDALLASFGLALSAWLLARHLAHATELSSALLLVYWALQLPALGEDIAAASRQYPALRNVTLRVMELLVAPDEASAAATEVEALPAATRAAPTSAGVDVRFEDVSVRAGGHAILDALTLRISAGSHVAVVGASGAGKSSLVGVLLGWHRPASGRVLVDGAPLFGGALTRLREHTAWIDPEVHLWNESLLENLRYGLPRDEVPPLGRVLELADLHGVLERLPHGLQTSLGEGGALVSGGEGQRVRFARAILRPDTRLAILDEPFRGLDRDCRRALLERTREKLRDATLLCITHDVGETLSFPRVLVVDGGRVVEDGHPEALRAEPTSRYRALLDAERALRDGLWESTEWRRLRMVGGQLDERTRPTAETS